MIPRLSPRLQAVADLVLPGVPAADVGCDHGRLAAWWAASGRLPAVIASDLRAGPLEGARALRSRAGLTHLEVRQGSGLTTLRPGEVATIAMAGMGGPLMLELLAASPEVLRSAQRVILQPNTAWQEVRRNLAEGGVPLAAETLTEDAGHIYLTLAFDPRTEGASWNEADIELGPHLRRERPPVFERWLAGRRNALTTLRARLGRELGEGHPRVRALDEERARFDQLSSASMNRAT